jgi:hypothetical protein
MKMDFVISIKHIKTPKTLKTQFSITKNLILPLKEVCVASYFILKLANKNSKSVVQNVKKNLLK